MYFFLKAEHNHLGDAGVSYLSRAQWPKLSILDISNLFFIQGSNNITCSSSRIQVTSQWPRLKMMLLGTNIEKKCITASQNRE